MDATLIYRLIYASVGIFGAFLVAQRLMEGAWVAGLFPLAIVGFCAYRLYSMADRSSTAE